MVFELQHIETHIFRLGDLVQTLLRDATSLSNSNQEVFILPLVEQVHRLVDDEAFTKNIKVVRDISASLPPIRGTAAYISQALLNLVVNAINHTRSGGTVTLFSQVTPDCITLSVKDTGKGIPSDLLPHIFEPGVTTAQTAANVGLGLVFVKRVMDTHNGTVSVSTEPGKGSIFSLSFPLNEMS